jgi:ribonuclease I
MPTRRSRNEVMGDAEYCDAGQDQKRHCASYAALQTGAREMIAHGLWPSDTFKSANRCELPWFRKWPYLT